MTSPILVTGIRAEAALARRALLPAVCAGSKAGRAALLAQALVEAGAPALVSFGIAGGLAPGLKSGTILLPETVIVGAERLAVTPSWRARLNRELAGAAAGALLGAETIIDGTAAKARAHAQTGAIAVDLESGAVALACRSLGLPFLVLRVVADPAERPLPPAALVALDPGGGPDIKAVLESLGAHPTQLPALLRLAWDTKCALSSLACALRRVEPMLRAGV